jgi:hypothetical protein
MANPNNNRSMPAAVKEAPVEFSLPAPPPAPGEQDFAPEIPPPPPAQVKRGEGIMVKAVQPGFFQGDRKIQGDIFEIAGYHRLGFWMECLDPKHQVEHEKMKKAGKHVDPR